MIFPLVLGLAGFAVLVSLGLWQVQRLAWKEGVLAEIAARIAAAPVALPAAPDPAVDQYRAVTVTGTFAGREIDVLVSRKQVGPGVRPVAAFETAEGRTVLVDRGFLPEGARADARPGPGDGQVTVTGNLLWPDEVDGFTPAPDARTGLWFARDLPALAAALGAEPVLVVARSATGGTAEPLPVDTSGIPNDHLGYAVQWFALAAVWAGMTGYLLWRIRRRTV